MQPTSTNIIKCSSFFDTEEEAQRALEEKILVISQNNKLIVSAKKELIDISRRANGAMLFRFTIVTANKRVKD